MYKKSAIVFSLAVLAAACGSSDGDDNDSGAVDPDLEEEVVVIPDDVDFELDATDISELTDVAPIETLVASEQEDGSILVEFEMSSRTCSGYVLDVTESSTDVALVMRSGLLEGKTFDDCQDGVYTYRTNVDLEEPLGDRPLVVGEDLEPEPGSESDTEQESDSEEAAVEPEAEEDE